MKSKSNNRLWLKALLGAFFFSLGMGMIHGQDSCCDQSKIKKAMTEEALKRIQLKTAADKQGRPQNFDYLTEQAYAKIKPLLAQTSGGDELLAYLRQILQQPAMDKDIEEFQTLVGHFVLGMSLEIGNTLQDEYDLAWYLKEKISKLNEELEKFPRLSQANLHRVLFQLDISEKTIRKIRSIEVKWKKPPPDADTFSVFNTLRKNMTGNTLDEDQRLAFDLGECYQSQYPFLKEFLENYRRLADAFREAGRYLNARLADISD